MIEDAAIAKMSIEDRAAAAANDRPAVIQKVKGYLLPEQWLLYSVFRAERNELDKDFSPPKQQLALSINNCAVKPEQTTVMIRGNPHSPGAKVEPGFPSVLGFADPTIPPPEKGARSSGRRSGASDGIDALMIARRRLAERFSRTMSAPGRPTACPVSDEQC